MDMTTIVQTVIGIGGFGYLNYYIFNRLVDFNTGSDKEMQFQILFFSSLDYVLFLLVSSFIKNTIAAGFVTAFVACAVTVFLPRGIKLLYRAINAYRGKDGSLDLIPVSVFDIFTADKRQDLVFIFSTEDNHLISAGQLINSSGKYEELSFIVAPFIEIHKEYTIKTEEQVLEFFEQKQINSEVYINFEKKIKVYHYGR